MAMRIVAIAIILGLGFFVLKKNQEAKNTEFHQVETGVPGETITVQKGEEVVDHAPKFFKEGVEGNPPPVDPEFDVDVEFHLEGVRKVLTFKITEKHGWYADHLFIDFWYVNDAGNQVGQSIRYMCRNYLDFGETLVEQTTPIDLEFPHLEGNFGTSANWRAVVGKSGKVLAPK